MTKCYENESAVEEPVTYELLQFKERVLRQDPESIIRNKKSLLRELQQHFKPFSDSMISFDIHVDRHHYVDEEEMWVEERYTLELSLEGINAPFLAELERILGKQWELQTDRHGIMLMRWELFGGNLTRDME